MGTTLGTFSHFPWGVRHRKIGTLHTESQLVQRELQRPQPPADDDANESWVIIRRGGVAIERWDAAIKHVCSQSDGSERWLQFWKRVNACDERGH